MCNWRANAVVFGVFAIVYLNNLLVSISDVSISDAAR